MLIPSVTKEDINSQAVDNPHIALVAVQLETAGFRITSLTEVLKMYQV